MPHVDAFTGKITSYAGEMIKALAESPADFPADFFWGKNVITASLIFVRLRRIPDGLLTHMLAQLRAA